MKKGLVFALALILVTALVPCLSAQTEGHGLVLGPQLQRLLDEGRGGGVQQDPSRFHSSISSTSPMPTSRARSRPACRPEAPGSPTSTLFQDFRIEQSHPGLSEGLRRSQGRRHRLFQVRAYKVGPMTAGNSIYGIPFDTGSTGLWLRTDYLKAAGLNPESYMKEHDLVRRRSSSEIAVKAKTGKPLIAYESDSFDTPPHHGPVHRRPVLQAGRDPSTSIPTRQEVPRHPQADQR